ncbi:hypothetical protein HY643_04900 [Candidatus Woesearchaeota archaeon]|nr:hypothetical protein [Candidatus Woesearchaeota archaeon]
MRDDAWLAERLSQIWNLLFPEVERKNNVIARFKGGWKNKFGHIKKIREKDTEIAINGLFKNDAIPEYVIDVTLAHELIHYSHGFNSPLPKKYNHPHAGGIVTKELKRRGFSHLLKKEKAFVKKDWLRLYKQLCPEKNESLSRRPRRFFFF